ncbi:uncharacterized protein LOC128999879 [Macrosteles quadrilineatus]|uniref:uncharacterized protein LOC128999879 n=1 Tax=Macrosteles quadrilineatus TaxID=74068 RepID=UPI0023E0BFFB|nr:uncharacterized protein LOC128999879 [Macrosteles quadrilineatus]
MTASVLGTTFLLVFPIVCQAAEYAVVLGFVDVVQYNQPKVSCKQYATESNNLFCAVYEAPFKLNVNENSAEFNSIAFVQNLQTKEFVRAFAHSNCKDFAEHLSASGDSLEFQVSPDKVASISKEKNELKADGTSFTASQWKKTSQDSEGVDPSCKEFIETTFPQSSANSQENTERSTPTSETGAAQPPAGEGSKNAQDTSQQTENTATTKE